MAVRTIRMLCAGGDKTLAEWNPETIEAEKLEEIQRAFQQKMKEGFFAADVTDGRNVLTKRFDPNADLLLIPRVQGG